jgi:hypothetical protein
MRRLKCKATSSSSGALAEEGNFTEAIFLRSFDVLEIEVFGIGRSGTDINRGTGGLQLLPAV